MANLLRILGDGLSGLAFPPVCLGCGERIGHGGMILCLPCARAVDRADPSELAERLARLPEARDAIDYAFSLWIFDKGGILQQVHHALKYGNRPSYGVRLGEIVGAALEYKFERRPPPEVIIPIPLHRSRLYERGYNQGERLATGIARVLGVPVQPAALVRVRSTQTQTNLSREKRWTNLEGAFAVPSARGDTVDTVRGRTILLVDDVMTTGATSVAAALALKSAGAFSVYLATLALART